ncbi:MAG: glycosyl hydrolase [Sphingobacteriales bacterium 50-39]|nr:glycosyl hydrolase [Sphingobacteriales bacterium]OJW61003.1 MAG: glycosyl hydrolase [Sphingobacteriales bacterium 50-39]
MKIFFRVLVALILGATKLSAQSNGSVPGVNTIESNFSHPPPAARPGVYWYFMDGNRNKAAMSADLESMKRVGIGNVLFLEVNVGVPRGPVDFLSEEWNELFRHAVRECERLGIELVLGTGPGWTGSGGPWVKPEESMQELVGSTTYVTTPSGGAPGGAVPGTAGRIVLPVPAPRKPYFGMGVFTPPLKKEWDDFYRDVAVLAWPTRDSSFKIKDIDEKALYYREPYTSVRGVKAYLPSPSDSTLSADIVIPKEKVLDLTDKLSADGVLTWDAPPGNWTIVRLGVRNNGAVTRPAPIPGLGFECDKMDTVALNDHLQDYVGKLLAKTGDPDPRLEGGFKRLHIDSWEMGSQNWTPHFREEFIRRRGYDPQPFYPVYLGNIVGSLGMSERFLWDLRQTSQELVLAYHAEQVKKYSHRHGMTLSIEPYDMNPTADLELGAVADVPMCEFWSKGYGFNSSFSCIEATSIAHVNGIPLVPAESFTAGDEEGWKQYPGSMKNQGDWAFATGINRLVYHTFQHQALDSSLKPGMTMGPYGVHWNRSQTWWPMVGAYHNYIARCQYLLQQGRTVADILYLTPEGSPHVFRAPVSAMTEDDAVMPDRKGFNFDGCAPSQLYKASVRDGKIVFPGGAEYRVLVLPSTPTMTPTLLKKIIDLVQAGATVMGAPPQRSPSLAGYPGCDEQVGALVKEGWGGTLAPGRRLERGVGKGRIVWGGNLAGNDNLYPSYGVTAEVLHSMGVREDFSSDGSLRYTHRTGEGWDAYFVSNKRDSGVRTEVTFRVGSGTPELWDAVTGRRRKLPEYTVKDGMMVVPMVLRPYESFFVVFRKENLVKPGAGLAKRPGAGKNFSEGHDIRTLRGPWAVSFDTVWGGPAKVRFDSLYDWTRSGVDGIRYYSGIAHYRKIFDAPVKSVPVGAAAVRSGDRIYLDLGVVKDMARVRLNGADLGVVWTAPWRVDITDHLRAGNNELDIEVVNRWPNRLIGDERRPDDGIKDGKWPEWLLAGKPRMSGRYTFTTYKHYSADSPLLPSGLLGPVRVVVAP